jgi:hypothetical protein
LPESSELALLLGFFYMPKIYEMWQDDFYFPYEGRRAEDFFALKNPTASAGFEPANLGTKRQHDTSRPPKPLTGVVTVQIYTDVFAKVMVNDTRAPDILVKLEHL